MCYLKLKKPVDALTHCDIALSINSKLPKAILRKGQALIDLGKYDKAQEILNNCLLECNNNNDDATKVIKKNLLEEIKKIESILKEGDKKSPFRGLFNKK